jgi:hypothetical protein
MPQFGGPYNSHLVGVDWHCCCSAIFAFSACLDLLINTRMMRLGDLLLSPLNAQLANEAAVFLVLFAEVSAEIRAAHSNRKEP